MLVNYISELQDMLVVSVICYSILPSTELYFEVPLKFTEELYNNTSKYNTNTLLLLIAFSYIQKINTNRVSDMPLGLFIVWVYFTVSSPRIGGKSNFYPKPIMIRNLKIRGHGISSTFCKLKKS